jgi:hypothetical protein
VEVCLSEMKDYLSLRKLLGNKIYQTWFKQLENDGSVEHNFIQLIKALVSIIKNF